MLTYGSGKIDIPMSPLTAGRTSQWANWTGNLRADEALLTTGQSVGAQGSPERGRDGV